MEVLEAIIELRKCLRPNASFVETEGWWSLVTSIEIHLGDYDHTPSDAELEAVSQLKSGVTAAIVAIRDKLPSPSVMSAQSALLTLERLIKGRSIRYHDSAPLE